MKLSPGFLGLSRCHGRNWNMSEQHVCVCGLGRPQAMVAQRGLLEEMLNRALPMDLRLGAFGGSDCMGHTGTAVQCPYIFHFGHILGPPFTMMCERWLLIYTPFSSSFWKFNSKGTSAAPSLSQCQICKFGKVRVKFCFQEFNLWSVRSTSIQGQQCKAHGDFTDEKTMDLLHSDFGRFKWFKLGRAFPKSFLEVPLSFPPPPLPPNTTTTLWLDRPSPAGSNHHPCEAKVQSAQRG